MAFPTGSQVMLLQKVRGPYFENLCFKPGGVSMVIGITDGQVIGITDCLGFTPILNAAG